MLGIVGTVPDADLGLLHGPARLEGGRVTVAGRELEVQRGTPALLAAALQVAAHLGRPEIHAYLAGDTGRGEQPLCFVDQTDHAMRIGWYTDTYRRTEHGWRLATRSMTFLRRSGERDSGRAHDPTRPTPTSAAGEA